MAALAGTAATAGGTAAAGGSMLLPALSLAGSAAAAGASYLGQQAQINAQNASNDQWVAYQKQAAANALAQDTADRQKASAAQQQTLQQLSPQTQQANQQTAATNLNTAMLAGSPAAPDSNVAVLGGGDPNNAKVTSDMASRVTDAARQAQGRIAALAGISSYGGGYNDMGQLAGQAINSGDEAIKLQSDFRTGNTATLGVAQNVQPINYVQGSNIAGTIANTLAQAAGNAYGSYLRTPAPAATAAPNPALKTHQ